MPRRKTPQTGSKTAATSATSTAAEATAAATSSTSSTSGPPRVSLGDLVEYTPLTGPSSTESRAAHVARIGDNHRHALSVIWAPEDSPHDPPVAVKAVPYSAAGEPGTWRERSVKSDDAPSSAS